MRVFCINLKEFFLNLLNTLMSQGSLIFERPFLRDSMLLINFLLVFFFKYQEFIDK